MKFWPVFAAIAAVVPAQADSIGAPFSQYYTLTSVTRPVGLAGGFGVGDILLDPADLNHLWIGEFASFNSGEVVDSAVARDPVTNNIIGFTGSLSVVDSTPFIDGGLTYGPGNDLYFTQYPNNTIGEIKPGNNSASYTAPTGIGASPGGLAFVPTGFGGAGNATISSYTGDFVCSAAVAQQGDGSYAFGACGNTVNLGYTPEGILYVPAGTPGFSSNSILIDDFANGPGAVIAYQTDAHGMPILATASTLIAGITGAEGIAIDPVSGDILASPYNSGTWDVLTPITTPEPVSAALAAGGLLALALCRRKKRDAQSR